MLQADIGSSTLHAFGRAFPCTHGRAGAVPANEKREGDGASPIGCWPILGALLRPDRVPLSAFGGQALKLPWRWLRPWDGWSDDVRDPAYNRPVRHPHPFSAEQLWREDHVYDLILVLGHNSGPVQPGAGSAIFWHLSRPDGRPTEGCIAIERAAMLDLLPRLEPGMALEIRAGAAKA